MGYSYETQKLNIFTEEGQRMFLKIRDRAHELLKKAGACRMQEAIKDCSGDIWDMLACMDRLVELGEILELTDSSAAAQHRVFVSGRYG